MKFRKRQGNRPERRIAPFEDVEHKLASLSQNLVYEGSAHHKLRPGDYGFHPPSNPRSTKSTCDGSNEVLLSDATALFFEGVKRGMVSKLDESGLPKYVWAKDANGNVFEAKRGGSSPTTYHGYRLGDDERDMRAYVTSEWQRREAKP